ncbi:MAG: GTPase Era [Ignavibacteriaceae bacterium]|nr:GTPase Era [Ignavibacteriaceae bacterium]
MENKAGFVTILGLPNAGKSTLLNALLGQKLSITTKKPQTTRKKILGILSEEDYQIIFLDTPGILKPSYLLQQKMMNIVNKASHDADIYIYIMDVSDDPTGEKLFSEEVIQASLKTNKPKLLIINKVDLSNQENIVVLLQKFNDENKFDAVIPISASLAYNISSVLAQIIERLPEHPKYYPDDIVADESERFFVSEIIREKVFELYQEEIPYSTEVRISDYKEREAGKDLIRAVIIVERDSQKGIVIGKNGEAIKRLGAMARKDIESFLQREVFLDLRVKVKSKWRSNENMLRSFGYDDSEE